MADIPAPEATDFSESVFDELQERVAKRALQAMDTAFPLAKRRIRNDWSSFTRVEDWMSFHAARPDWQELSTHEIADREGGEAFYQAFRKWCVRESHGDGKKRKELFERIFPARYRPIGKQMNSLSEWKAYLDAKPEWAGLSTTKLASSSEGNKFYYSFLDWCRAESDGDEEKRKALMGSLFPPMRRNWKDSFRTVDDWKAHFESNAAWAGMTTASIQKDRDGGCGFYNAFKKWCRSQAGEDESKFKDLIETVFPPLRTDWDRLHSIDQWTARFETNPDWKGLSSRELKAAAGGSAFYNAFLKWCKAASDGDEEKRKALMRAVFPIRGKCRWTFED